MPARRPQLAQDVFLNLLRVHERLNGAFAELFRAHGLSPAQYNVLRILRGAGEALPCSAIGERLVTRDPDVTRLVDRMERQELVRRLRSAHDRRVVLVELAPGGRRLLEGLDEPVRELHASLTAHVPLARLESLRSLLREVLPP